MSNFASSESVVLKRVRLDYHDIFTVGRPSRDGGKAKFKAKVIMAPDSEAVTVAKKAMGDAARALWGENAKNVVPTIPMNNKCLRDGNMSLDQQGAVRPDYKDMMFLSCSNDIKPQVVGPARHNGKFVNINQDGTCSIDGVVQQTPPYKITVPYRGCYVDLKVRMTAGKSFKADSGEQLPNQIYAKLEAIKFVCDGEAFGSGPTSAEGFDDEEGVDPVDISEDDLF